MALLKRKHDCNEAERQIAALERKLFAAESRIGRLRTRVNELEKGAPANPELPILSGIENATVKNCLRVAVLQCEEVVLVDSTVAQADRNIFQSGSMNRMDNGSPDEFGTWLDLAKT